jgi:hypothetical protein
MRSKLMNDPMRERMDVRVSISCRLRSLHLQGRPRRLALVARKHHRSHTGDSLLTISLRVLQYVSPSRLTSEARIQVTTRLDES